MPTSKTTGWIDRIGRRLKLRDLHIFLAVAERGNMARTAEHLGVSRPVVSKAIADLEHTLGVHLVERSRDGVELTMYGRALLKRSTVVFDDIRLGVKEIEFLADPSLGEIRVGCPEVIAAGIVPVIISRLFGKYPRAKVEVVHTAQVDSNALLFQQLRDRSIDVFIGRVPPRLKEDDLVVDILLQDRMFVVAGSNSPWARKRKIDLAELADAPWILPPPDHVISIYLARIFRSKGLQPPSAHVVSNSTGAVSALLRSGPYLAIIPDIALHFYMQWLGLVALPIDLPSPPGPNAIVTLKSRGQPPLLPAFVECAHAVAKSIPRRR